MAKVFVAKLGEVPPGEGRAIEVGTRAFAVFNLDGVHYALDNDCPHRGGPLGEGDLVGTAVACPWHGWRWDVRSGSNTNNPAVKVACFPVTVEDGQIFVEVP